MVGDKKVLSLITFSKNIHENENDNGNVTLVKEGIEKKSLLTES